MVIDIDKVIVKDRIRKDYGDIKELANDIKENGLINPPVVNKDYELLAGERRLKACKMLGWKQINVTMMDTRDAEHELNIEISENDVRKGFSKAERVDYMKRLLKEESRYFAIRVYKFIQDAGGSVWVPQYMDELSKQERKDFIDAIYTLDAFSKQMIENIGGYGIEG